MKTFCFKCAAGLLLVGLLLGGCSPAPVRMSAPEPALGASAAIPDAYLLDVNIAILDAGIEQLDPRKTTTTPGVRRAEAHYVAQRLRHTLDSTAQWGTVRVVPQSDRDIDLMLSGTIVKSDGQTLEIEIEAVDSRAQQWFKRRYAESVNRFAYDMEIRRRREPFQNVYNRVANDLREFLTQQNLNELAAIRHVAELRFAARFAPQAFNEYLARDAQGHYSLARLPAENDPVLQRVRRIRVRDQAFVERMQQSYEQFDQQMAEPYDHWRQESLAEAEMEAELKAQANTRTLLGALAIIGGIAAQGSNSSAARTAGVIGIGGGALAVKSGFDKRAEASLHTQAMKGLSDSLNAAVQPQTIELTDRNIELTGTVEQQYQQWQELLGQIYALETGQDAPGDTPLSP